MAAYRLISADSHFVEPPTMWAERMDKKFRDRAPRTVTGLSGREGEWFVCENITPMPVAGFFGAGVPSQDLPEHNKKGFDQAPKSVWDPAYRIVDQDRDGVQAEVIYTSMGMPLFGLDDADLRLACFRAFNEWAAEYCRYDLKRLIPLGLITLEDIPSAVAELQRIAKQGMRGAMIWAELPDERLYTVQHRLGAVGGLQLPMRASEYIKRQVYATFIADPVFVDSLHRYGPDNIMWSSDYPHTAATFPRSQEIVAKRFGQLPEEQRQKIVHDTAARVYGLD